MADETANLAIHHLQALRSEMGDLRQEMHTGFKEMHSGFKDVNGKIGILADGLLVLRRDVENIDRNVQTLVIAVAGHGERLVNVEDRLGVLENPPGQPR